MAMLQFHRIMLKLSGDILKGDNPGGIDFRVVDRIAGEIIETHSEGYEIGVVIGGGNFFRGADIEKAGYERVTADNMGMLSTVINALALQNAIESRGLETRVMTAIPIVDLAEPFISRRAVRHLEKGRVVLFAAGTGNPFFTTDTAAALRASQIGADVILKGTKVDGVYDRDPAVHKGAVKLDKVDYMDVIKRNLKVMDMTAITFCMDNSIPIIVFNLLKAGNLLKTICGDSEGTLIKEFKS